MPGLTLPSWLGRAAGSYPDRLALIAGPTRWTFAELDRQALALAQQLASVGVRGGDQVALLAGNGVPFVTCVHALARLGVALVPLNLRLTEDELAWQVKDAGVTLLLADEEHAARGLALSDRRPGLRCAVVACDGSLADGAAPTATRDGALSDEIDLDATQAIMYTSGTTGRPKGAIITYGMQWWNATASALNLGLLPDDRWLVCLPLYHVGGLTTLMKSVIYGMPVVLHERFDAIAVNAAIRAERVTMISVVAAMLRRMLDVLDAEGSGDGRGDGGGEVRYPSWLRCVLLGGGPAPLPLLEDCARRGIPVVQTYGMTESCSQAVTLAPADALRKLGSAGRPLLPVQLRVTRDDGAPADVGESGEIQLRGPTITPGYIGNGGAPTPREGWLVTGDIGYLDTDGYLYVLDRRSDLIISGGENVYPAEIEAALLAHPDVAEAGVCGVPDSRWGSVPVAFVHPRESTQPTPAELLAFLEPRLARYKRPRAIVVTGPLPRNAAGKLLRRKLPEMLPPGESSAPAL